jgi:hypothetical protein
MNSSKASITDFLNPKPVVGTGACAAMVLAFTTSLCTAFPQLPGAFVALALSAIFAAAQVMAANNQKSIVKMLYGIICTLVIFSAAQGGNTTAVQSQSKPDEVAPPAAIHVGSAASPWSLIPSAEAASPDVFSEPLWAASSNSVSGGTGIFYYAYTTTNGFPVYTNVAGQAYTNTIFRSSQQRIFRPWGWMLKN